MINLLSLALLEPCNVLSYISSTIFQDFFQSLLKTDHNNDQFVHFRQNYYG